MGEKATWWAEGPVSCMTGFDGACRPQVAQQRGLTSCQMGSCGPASSSCGRQYQARGHSDAGEGMEVMPNRLQRYFRAMQLRGETSDMRGRRRRRRRRRKTEDGRRKMDDGRRKRGAPTALTVERFMSVPLPSASSCLAPYSRRSKCCESASHVVRLLLRIEWQ